MDYVIIMMIQDAAADRHVKAEEFVLILDVHQTVNVHLRRHIAIQERGYARHAYWQVIAVIAMTVQQIRAAAGFVPIQM